MKCYCTAGRGTEIFLKEEIYRRWENNVLKVIVEDGKVFFELRAGSVPPTELLSLKSAERIFLLIFHEKATKIENPKTFIDNLIARGLSDRQAWYDCITIWKAVNGSRDDTDNVSGVSDEPTAKRARLSLDEDRVRFAVAMKCTGSVRYRLHPQRTPRQLAIGICRHTGWKTDVRHPLIDVSVHLSDAFVTVGVPLVSEPLSRRSFIKHYGLRTTVASIMEHLLNIQRGDTVLDPMCGKATILLEAAHANKEVSYIGVDKDLKQLGVAQENIEFARRLGHTCIALLQGDVTGLPLPSCSIEKIVSDAPFGHKHTTDGDIHTFYLDMLVELFRVLVPGGRLVLLTSPDLRRYIYKLLDKEMVDNKTKATDHPERNLKCGSDLKHSGEKNIANTACENAMVNSNTDAGNDTDHDKEIINDIHKEVDKKLKEPISDLHNDKTNTDKDGHNGICDNCDDKQCVCVLEANSGSSLSNIPTANLENITAIDTESVELKCNTETTNVRELSEQVTSDIDPNWLDLKFKLKGFQLSNSHYMKLGDTDSYIVVIEKLLKQGT